MNEPANTTTAGIVRIDALACEARAYSGAIATNTMQLGRVFCEAKSLVPHGEWSAWVEQNTGMSERSAQNVMAIYKRFGDKPMFEGMEKTKLFRMLSLPEAKEEQFLQENDVRGMSTRQLEEAIREARADERRKAEAENRAKNEAMMRQLSEACKARDDAEADIQRMMSAPKSIPQEALDEIKRLKTVAQEAMDDRQKAQLHNIKLMNELQEQQDMLEDTQEQFNKAQQDLLNLQSTMARGDADRVPSDSLSIDSFASAVRSFIGACARLPYMSKTFCGMSLREKNEWDEMLQTVEGFCTGARKAMNTIVLEEA